MAGQRLDRGLFDRPVVEVARSLLGAMLVTDRDGERTVGRIVETEAYAGPEDSASHAGRLRRGREMMGGPSGRAYICRAYGLHVTFNIVTQPEGSLSAVLVRALEPVAGVEIMRHRRGVDDADKDTRLASGPGNLARAMGITLADDGLDLTVSNMLYLCAGEPPVRIARSGRIGLTRGIEAPWRFFDAESRSVSVHRRGEIVT